jgi:hypothetical protein
MKRIASEYRKTIPYVKIPCGLCRRDLIRQEIGCQGRNKGQEVYKGLTLGFIKSYNLGSNYGNIYYVSSTQ